MCLFLTLRETSWAHMPLKDCIYQPLESTFKFLSVGQLTQNNCSASYLILTQISCTYRHKSYEGQLARTLSLQSCTSDSALGKTQVSGGITNRMSGACLIDICFAELSNSQLLHAASMQNWVKSCFLLFFFQPFFFFQRTNICKYATTRRDSSGILGKVGQRV